MGVDVQMLMIGMYSNVSSCSVMKPLIKGHEVFLCQVIYCLDVTKSFDSFPCTYFILSGAFLYVFIVNTFFHVLDEIKRRLGFRIM